MTESKHRWENKVYEYGSSKCVVTMPIDDIEDHDEPGFMCPCGPRIIESENAVPHVVHNSFDGREADEIPTV